jgi:pimeloyl-ACP methyl ester carboxylesterase
MRFLLIALLGLLSAARADAAPDGFRTYVDGPWGQIHVRVAGRESDPTVVLVHQMTWSSVQYKFAQGMLAARGVRSVAMDIPGYGLSDGPAEEPSAAAYADAILPVLDRFGLARAILLGTNTGATFIAVLADRHPERVAHLILEGVPIWTAEERAKLLAPPPFDQTPRPDGSQLSGRWRFIRDVAGDRLSLPATQESVMQFFIAGPREAYAHNAVFRTDLAPVVKRIKASATVLTYPGQDLYRTSRDVVRLRPDFKVVELAVGRSMTPSYDAPEVWADAVAAAIKAH